MSAFVKRSGPLGFLFACFIAGMLLLSASRLGLYWIYADRFADIGAHWRIFLIGLRMDTVIVSYTLAPVTLILFLIPASRTRNQIIAFLLALTVFILCFLEASSPTFIADYGERPNRFYFEYLNHPKEVGMMLWGAYKWAVIATLLIAGSLTTIAAKLTMRYLEALPKWSFALRLAIFIFLIPLLVGGVRASFGSRAVSLSTAAFSDNHLANQLAMSSAYTLSYSLSMLTQEQSSEVLYGDMPWPEIVSRVKRDPTAVTEALPESTAKAKRHPNLVIFVQESMGARFVGYLGGLPLTPNIDRLSGEGLRLTNLYATGTRTERGLEALLAGFPPSPAASVLKRAYSQHNFFTLATVLKPHGYHSDFIYGGISNFDNMRAFFLGNDFDRVIDQRDFVEPDYLGTWGVDDVTLVQKANEVFKSHGDKPFMGVIMSTTAHGPFEFPQGRIDLYNQPARTRENAIKYADHAIGELFRLARKEDYFDNTIFLVVADHDARIKSPALAPLANFHIPGFIIGPGVPKKSLDVLASQIDLPPTLLGYMGIPDWTPMIGNNLALMDDSSAGRAIMQYGNNYSFRIGNRLTVLQPYQSARTFNVSGYELMPSGHDKELESNALAHVLWPSKVYQQRLYQGKNEPRELKNLPDQQIPH